MKSVTVKFNNVWDEYGDVEEYEILVFNIPDGVEVDIENETGVLHACSEAFECYDMEDEESVEGFYEDYPSVTSADLEIAKDVLEYDGCGASGLTASRIADFISKKYSGVDYVTLNPNYDLEIDID